MPARRFPDALAFLVACLIVAASLTWIIPAGEYDRRDDPVTGRRPVVPGTYHHIAAAPVSPFAAIVAIPRGFEDAAAIIAFVLLVGAGLTVVDRTGAPREGIDWLIGRLHGRDAIVMPIIALVFAIGGVVEGTMEEIIALVPILLVVTERLGYPPIMAVAMSLGPAAIGGAFSPMNPFQVGIAQKLADLPLMSGWPVRTALLVPATVVWIWATVRAAARSRRVPPARETAGAPPLRLRSRLLLLLVAAAFVLYIVGVVRLGWQFEEMSALFFLLGVVAGLAGGLGIAGTAEALADGFRGMAYAGVLIGFARAIYLVLADGHVIDTIVRGLFIPISALPPAAAAVAMMAAQTVVHVPVPSTTGQAVLTMPIVVPLSDLLGLSSDLTVLAYQLGGGLCELVTPTNGALMAILAAAGVGYDRWLRFVFPLFAVMMVLGAGGLVVIAALHLL
jgi:uncharacterized ion transporter superfamily protein YfcC